MSVFTFFTQRACQDSFSMFSESYAAYGLYKTNCLICGLLKVDN